MGSLPILQVHAVVVDPRDPRRVFAAGPAGVFRSEDSGLNWQPSSEGLGMVSIVALAQHPAQPDRLYAASADGKLFRSDDAARTWQAVTNAK